MKLEIERKFLLKSLPEINPSEIILINQYYRKNENDIWERVRQCDSNINGTYYVHTIKKLVSKGVNIEDEYEMSENQFNDFVKTCKSDKEYRYISKERWIYPDGKLKWEVDKFDTGYHLIIGEIEIPRKNYELTIPKFISDVSLLEVTGLKQFSNRNLSKKFKND